MKTTELLRQKTLTSVAPAITRLGKMKTAFTLSSFMYCAVHWVTNHNFSVYVFSAALVFGSLVAAAVAWLSQLSSRS